MEGFAWKKSNQNKWATQGCDFSLFSALFEEFD